MKLIILSIVIVIILLLLIFRKNTKEIPKIIWTYWHSENDMPKFIKKCIQNWKDKNPGYKINVITEKTLEKYVGKHEAQKIIWWKYNDSSQRMSDLVRLSVLSKNGGIWLDASCVCNESFDWIFKENASCILYSIPEISTQTVLESWFIACTPNNEYITKVNEEFRNIDTFPTMRDYINSISHVDRTGIDYNIYYLLVYLVMKKVFEESDDTSNIKVLNASHGPYIYHLHGGINSICNSKFQKPKFFKFRKEERNLMNDEIEKCLFMV